jgi:RNA polymerase sigma-70 factor (ECF subfamily)
VERIEESLIVKDQAMEIYTHLHELSEPYKEIFMLRVFGELSFKQIGAIFKKTENWACVTYHRARTKIYDKMEGK